VTTPIPATEYLPVVAFLVGWLLALLCFVLLVRGARRGDGMAWRVLPASRDRLSKLKGENSAQW